MRTTLIALALLLVAANGANLRNRIRVDALASPTLSNLTADAIAAAEAVEAANAAKHDEAIAAKVSLSSLLPPRSSRGQWLARRHNIRMERLDSNDRLRAAGVRSLVTGSIWRATRRFVGLQD